MNERMNALEDVMTHEYLVEFHGEIVGGELFLVADSPDAEDLVDQLNNERSVDG